MHGKRRRCDRRIANAASAGGADAVCRHDAALRGLGWIVVGLRHPVSGAHLSFAAYLEGPKPGAIVYNAAHSYMAPVSLMVAGFALSSPLTLSIAMIWMAHIGIDRALGYGLKYSAGFGFTHLGRIGKDAAKTA